MRTTSPHIAGARSRTAQRRFLWLGLAAFGVFGGLWGVWAVLLVDLARSLDLSAGPLGVALSIGVVASIPVMFLGGKAADRWGRRAVLVASGVLMGVSFASLGFAGSYPALLGILLLWCATSGVYLVGGVAEFTSLRFALVSVAIAGVMIALLAAWLEEHESYSPGKANVKATREKELTNNATTGLAPKVGG